MAVLAITLAKNRIFVEICCRGRVKDLDLRLILIVPRPFIPKKHVAQCVFVLELDVDLGASPGNKPNSLVEKRTHAAFF